LVLFGPVVDEVSNWIDQIPETGFERIEGRLVVEHDERDARHDEQHYQEHSLPRTYRTHLPASAAGINAFYNQEAALVLNSGRERRERVREIWS
jgi:hypothetical protein